MISRLATLDPAASGRTAASPSFASRALGLCILALVIAGVAARLSPLVDVPGRLFWQFVTEDGYLMQTIARNIALGLGMSTAEGSMPTNGVQPLATFLFAGLHWLAGGSRAGGIALVTVASTVIAAAAAWFGYRVGLRLFAGLRHGRELAALLAALWFVAPHTVANSMNGLETGLYCLAITFTLNRYLVATADDAAPWGWGQRAVMGLWLGLAFLARNDAVFFVAALLIAHAFAGGASGGGLRHRMVDAVAAGVASLVVASPWLVHNWLLFGSIVPISGIAQSHASGIGRNLALLPANLFEQAFVFAPIPRRFEQMPVVMAAAGLLVLAACAGFWFFAGRRSLAARRFFIAGLLFPLGVAGYYGLFFGAPHFIPRYLSPTALFLWPFAGAAALMLLGLLLRTPGRVQAAMAAVGGVLALMFAAVAALGFADGTRHEHKQVVDWVQRNVPASTWVGAVQTGTLGFFHDRTINLDGKVNPAALRAILDHGHVLDYVVDSRIDVIADWAGMAGWARMSDASPRFTERFELLVHDPRANLAVLRRVGSLPELQSAK